MYKLWTKNGTLISNKVVKPHNGPSAVLVLIATTGNNVIQDETCFPGFGINGSPVSNCDEVYFGEGGLQMDYQIYTNKEYFGEGG